MKLFSLLFATVLGAAVLAPVTASAGHESSTRVTYDHHGNRIVWVYTCVGRDHHGSPIYRWVETSCTPPRRDYESGGYDRGGYDRGYRGGNDQCDSGYGSGISFRWSR